MSEKEIALYWLKLMDELDYFRHLTTWALTAEIQVEYRRLKTKVKEAAHELDLLKNRRRDSYLYNLFSKNIKEASGYGFRARANSTNIGEMEGSVADALDKM